ncbi:phosphatidylserine/phosphatidylglycerophosphate/cardiolipin synthase family protein [Rhizobium laguerreae]|uniref:phosphatidylserine/phosphatidylglycerophosphate/ cardiolipin synthase family protein n=1 Tax=Rhizobium laguerreae TaxID=1076926 RepID=UPI001441BB22|nr:phosphatidylserine/phosphatidylglycerophosphate/cardiolipin synthase family protein [Rhizobium laguerreae]NKM69180.1 phosphatidylserine/phosphatidylglycerophosphate/cardiolipin synthase family protein [Rhizobium laguerreae]
METGEWDISANFLEEGGPLMSPEEVYANLGRLVADAPNFRANDRLQTEEMIWMAKAYALLNEAGMMQEAISVQLQMELITTALPHLRGGYADKLLAAVHRALAIAELRAPTSVRGAFISAGNAFDAMTAVGRVLGEATTKVKIVDPYMDEKALTDFAILADKSVRIELMADSANVKPSLKPAVTRWQAQYTSERALEARLATSRSLHDRLIIVDGSKVYTLTQSLNAFAARSPASIVRLEGDAVPLKIAAYESFWNAAAPI